MEKVIQEWRIVETDDGYRIELKGDKEAMRHWVEHLRAFRLGRRYPRHGFPWGRRPPFGWRQAFWHGFCGPEDWEGDEAEGEEPKEEKA
ncbi:MAG: hypothetical protein FJ026_06385 [Chloroflexi bacterium]|nr:hypothetical protein [Chloroflexota bacterium]